MFAPFSVTTDVRRFDGQNGWHYLPFDDKTSKTLRPQVEDNWPALLKVKACIAEHSWTATVMPIKLRAVSERR